MGSERLTFEVDGREYRWSGGFGAIFHSWEWRPRLGDVRMIDGEMFYCYMRYRDFWWQPYQVSWTQPHVSAEKIRWLKRRIFGGTADD